MFCAWTLEFRGPVDAGVRRLLASPTGQWIRFNETPLRDGRDLAKLDRLGDERYGFSNSALPTPAEVWITKRSPNRWIVWSVRASDPSHDLTSDERLAAVRSFQSWAAPILAEEKVTTQMLDEGETETS